MQDKGLLGSRLLARKTAAYTVDLYSAGPRLRPSLRMPCLPSHGQLDRVGDESLFASHDAKPFAHEPLETRPPYQVIGQLLARKHSQRRSPAVGDHLRSIVH